MKRKFLFTLCLFLGWGLAAIAQPNYASKTLSKEDFEIIETTAQSIAEDYINFVSLIGVPGSDTDERADFIQKALEYMESRNSVVYNDLDPDGKTTTEFTAEDYLRNIPSFYPEGVAIYPETIEISNVFYDSESDRYFVKAEVERVLSGSFQGKKEVEDNRQKLDFYIKFYQGSAKSTTKIYLIDKHQDNLHQFQAVRIEDSNSTSLFTDEEKEKLKKEKKKALEENQQLKDQLSSMSDMLDEESRKRREAERKAREALRQAQLAQQEADEVKDQTKQMSAQLRSVLREEQQVYDKARALVKDYDYLMSKKTVRSKIHRAGYDPLRRFDKESIQYFNQLPTFKVLNQQRGWDASEARQLQSRLIGIYEETQKTMRSKHKVALSKKYQKLQEKQKKLFIKLGAGMAAFSDDFEGLADGPITTFNAQLALRFAKPGIKRGTLFGLYGTYGTMSPGYFGAILDDPNPNWNFEGSEDLNFIEGELGFTIKEFWRISAGVGSINVPTSFGEEETLSYFPVTTGLSVSFFRFIEIDVYGTALLGNDNIPMDKFRVGATANLILKF